MRNVDKRKMFGLLARPFVIGALVAFAGAGEGHAGPARRRCGDPRRRHHLEQGKVSRRI